MRAMEIDGGKLRVVECDAPEAVADYVLVRVAGAGVNRADLLQLAGAYAAPWGWPQAIPGLEFAGEVAATGPLVRDLRAGDRVFGIVGGGAHADHLLTTEALCARVPDALDLVEAGAVPEAFVTAHDALFTQAGLRPGERLLVHAAGSGVGTAAVQLARAAGAATVGTSRTADKLARARALGLDRGVVASAAMAEEIGEVDVVLDLVGGDYVSVDIAVCAPKGRIVVVGLLAGGTSQVDLGALMRKRVVLRGSVLRSRPEHEKAAATAAFTREVVPLLASGVVRPVVERVVPLEEAAAAYDLVRSNATFGKVVLAPSAPPRK